MNKLLLVTIIIIFSFQKTTAQNLENGSFENWVDDFDAQGNFVYEELGGYWATNNLVSTINSETTPFVLPETERVQQGSRAIRLQSGFLVGFGGGIPVGGLVGVGGFELNIANQFESYIEGKPFTSRPTALTGYYIYEPVDIDDEGTIINDECEIYTYLTKWNSGKRDTLGVAYFSSKETFNDYQYLEIPFDYYSEATPDTMFTVFATSKAAAPPLYHAGIGTVLIVDNFNFSYDPVGIAAPIVPLYDMNIYPNPTTDFIQLDIDHNTLLDFALFGIDGKVVLESIISTQQHNIDVRDLASGTYIYQIKEGNTTVAGGQIVVK